MTDIVERLRSSEPLPACPFDKISPHYLTMPNDKPCPFCGQENTLDGPDKCRGADTRIMGEAANEIERLRTELAGARKLIQAAGLMANVCFNAKQNDRVPDGIRQWLANTQEGFDRIRDDYLAVVSSPPNSEEKPL